MTGEKPDESWTEWIELDADGKVVDYFTTTNPNPKYDWYEIGGRWKNMLLRLDGRKVDSCPIGELDFETEINRLKPKLTVFMTILRSVSVMLHVLGGHGLMFGLMNQSDQ